MAVAQKVSMRSAAAARPARAAVVVRASAESRRAVLSGLFAGVAASVAAPAMALTPVDLFDDRKAIQTGFDIIYEARDLDLPQNQREGFTQARTDLAGTKARVKGSEAKIDTELEGLIKKNYWIEGRTALRRQVGTLRFDLNALASAKPKEEKKKALALKKEFLAAVEALDLALVNKNESKALDALTKTKSSLDSVLAAVL